MPDIVPPASGNLVVSVPLGICAAANVPEETFEASIEGMSEAAKEAPPVTRPCESVVTLVYVPAVPTFGMEIVPELVMTPPLKPVPAVTETTEPPDVPTV